MKPKKLKKDFPIFRDNSDLIYLDNAATSQKPEQVIKRVEKFYSKENANVGRGLYDLAGKATKNYRNARETVADFIGARTDEIVFVRNTTEAINLLAYTLEAEKVAVSEMAHHSEQLPWRENAETVLLPDKNGRIDVEETEEIVDESFDIISVSHISNVYGTVNDINALKQIADENDAKLVVDAAQSVSHMPVDVKKLDADFLVFSGHKMLGPTGIGVLYGKKDLLDEMPPYQIGGGMVQSVKEDEVSYSEAPEKFEAGTPNIAGAIGLAAAADYIDQVGLHNIFEHDKELCDILRRELEDIEGIDVFSPEDSIIVSFTADFAHPHDIAEIMNQNNIAARAGNHCAQPLIEKLDVNGAVRVSPYLYNTEEDVRKTAKAVRKAAEVFRNV